MPPCGAHSIQKWPKELQTTSSRCSEVPPSLGDRLTHILTAIGDIRTLLRGRSRNDFASDLVLRMAIERLFEIISEASRHIPDDLKRQDATIAWRRLADLGNWLRHAYHRIDPDILWNMAENDLEPLKQFVEAIVRSNQAK
ncbi:MAG TPA: DUF86 domain-containing protein [Xanthobacteraceae bacterium]|nr:DUF86 domain-containing protein [Xanthobacteraceae bacterium]